MLITLALVTALFTPPKPTVGDPITITFEQPATLDASPDYEVISHHGGHYVIRTFKPTPLSLSGTTGDTRFRNLVVPMRSVLAPDDKRQPAPLVAPHAPAASNLPVWLIAAAALAAVLTWVLVWKRRRAIEAASRPARPPVETFREAVANASTARQRWAALADATRNYMAARGIGRELTTSQAIAQLPHRIDPATPEPRRHIEHAAAVLRHGDLEKFSPWGAPPSDFDALAANALALTEALEPKPVVSEAAA